MSKLHLTKRTGRRLAGGATAVALIAAAATVMSSGTGAASPAPARQVTRIHLVERVASEHLADQGPKGLSAGDRLLIVSDVLTPAGRRIGRLDFVCTITGEGKLAGGSCQGALTLPGGQIHGSEAFGASGLNRFQAITGGTGKYIGAKGQFVVGDGTDAHTPFVVELVR
ncbi:MAG: hypothetical protein ACTHNU_12550 [Gaiellales bacterium]